MITFARQIDALGGAPEGTGEYNAGYHDGYSRAVEDAMEIAAKADSIVAELLAAAERALGQLGDHGGCSCMSEGPDCCAFTSLQTAIAQATGAA